MQGVKVYDKNNMPSNKGVGIFACAFMERFPLMPVEDEYRLKDARLRQNFIERIFVYKRWQNFVQNDGSRKDLVDFHTQHKLLIMAHSPKLLRELGKLVAQVKLIEPLILESRQGMIAKFSVFFISINCDDAWENRIYESLCPMDKICPHMIRRPLIFFISNIYYQRGTYHQWEEIK